MRDYMHQKKVSAKRTTSYVLFEMAYFCLALALFLSLTTIPYIVDEQHYAFLMKCVRYLGYFLVTVKIIREEYSVREILWMILGMLLFSIAGVTSGDNNLVCMFLFVIGMHNLDFDRIMLFCQRFLMTGIIIVILASIIGIIPNWLYVISERERYALGFFYPSHLSSCFFYFSMLTLYLLKDKLKLSQFIILEIINWLVYKLADSRAAFALLFLACVIFYSMKFAKENGKFQKIIKFFSLLAFPVCAIASFIACYFFTGTGFTGILNYIFHDRLKYGHLGLENYGIHLFGQEIEWIGNGGLGFVKEELEGAYNYVDCSYMKILFDYGLLVLLFVVIGYTLAVYQAYRKNNIYLCLALSMVALYSLIEPRLLEFGFNPFVLCLGAYMGDLKIPGDMKYKMTLRRCITEQKCNVSSGIVHGVTVSGYCYSKIGDGLSEYSNSKMEAMVSEYSNSKNKNIVFESANAEKRNVFSRQKSKKKCEQERRCPL